MYRPWTTDPESRRVRDMTTHYDKMAFPVDEDDNFGRLGIYFKRDDS